MIGNLTNLKVSVLAQFSGKYASNARTSMCEKSGPSESKPAAALTGSSAKMFPMAVALNLVNLDVRRSPYNGIIPIREFFYDQEKHEA